MMTCGVSFLALVAKRVKCDDSTQGTPPLLPRHRPQLLVIARVILPRAIWSLLSSHPKCLKPLIAQNVDQNFDL
jgi:hypothetical protein